MPGFDFLLVYCAMNIKKPTSHMMILTHMMISLLVSEEGILLTIILYVGYVSSHCPALMF